VSREFKLKVSNLGSALIQNQSAVLIISVADHSAINYLLNGTMHVHLNKCLSGMLECCRLIHTTHQRNQCETATHYLATIAKEYER
jgi:hypothetical protein